MSLSDIELYFSSLDCVLEFEALTTLHSNHVDTFEDSWISIRLLDTRLQSITTELNNTHLSLVCLLRLHLTRLLFLAKYGLVLVFALTLFLVKIVITSESFFDKLLGRIHGA